MAILPKSRRRVGLEPQQAPQYRAHMPVPSFGEGLENLGKGVSSFGESLYKINQLQEVEKERKNQLDALKVESDLSVFTSEGLTKNVYSVESGDAQDLAFDKFRNEQLPEYMEKLLEGKSERVRERASEFLYKSQANMAGQYFKTKSEIQQAELVQAKKDKYGREVALSVESGNLDIFYDGYLKEMQKMGVAEALASNQKGQVDIKAVSSKKYEEVQAYANAGTQHFIDRLLERDDFQGAKDLMTKRGKMLSSDVRVQLNEKIDFNENVNRVLIGSRDTDGLIDMESARDQIDNLDYGTGKKTVFREVVLKQAELLNKEFEFARSQKMGHLAQAIITAPDALKAMDVRRQLISESKSSAEVSSIDQAFWLRWGEDVKKEEAKAVVSETKVKEAQLYQNTKVMATLEGGLQGYKEQTKDINEGDAYVWCLNEAINAGYDIKKESELKSFFKDKVWKPSVEYTQYKGMVADKIHELGYKNPDDYMPYFLIEYDKRPYKEPMNNEQMKELIKKSLGRMVNDEGWFWDSTKTVEKKVKGKVPLNTFQLPDYEDSIDLYYRMMDQDILNFNNKTRLRLFMAGAIDVETGRVLINDSVRKKYFQYKDFGAVDEKQVNQLLNDLNANKGIDTKDFTEVMRSSLKEKIRFIESTFNTNTGIKERSTESLEDLKKSIKNSGGTKRAIKIDVPEKDYFDGNMWRSRR